MSHSGVRSIVSVEAPSKCSENLTRNPALGILHSFVSANLYRDGVESACNKMWE